MSNPKSERPITTYQNFKELFDTARQSIDYWIEGCFLAETVAQQEKARVDLLNFIAANYTPKKGD